MDGKIQVPVDGAAFAVHLHMLNWSVCSSYRGNHFNLILQKVYLLVVSGLMLHSWN